MYNFFIGIAIFMCQFHGAKFIPGRYLLFSVFSYFKSINENLCALLHKVGMMASLIGWPLTIPEIRV